MNPPATPSPAGPPAPSAPSAPVREPDFGVNEMRLGAGPWLAVLVLFGLVATLLPVVWKRVERFETGPDYRIPYALSRDYWLFRRRLEQVADPGAVRVLGDSVIWGEYVRPEGALSHHLDRETGRTNGFVNAGVNGLFPLALEGLVRDYGGPLAGRKVLLHCNLLWLTSPKADLSTPKQESFNHRRLVPQFLPRIPCDRADAAERLGAVIERHVPLFQWAGHLENTYFGQRSLPQWTMSDDGGDPPRYTNLWRNPLTAISLVVPSPFGPDPERGPGSPRHRPWNRAGSRVVEFEWVDAAASLQWAAFRRTVERLRSEEADVFVLVGPFNESMLSDAGRGVHARLRDTVVGWLAERGVPHLAPAALPAELYADASHPLTDGYALLARRMLADEGFRAWLGQGGVSDGSFRTQRKP
jgi:hypothetical protein